MGFTLKFDGDRRELVRERRDARIERKQQRRQARERKRAETARTRSASSSMQRIAEQEVRASVDRIVEAALDRHEQTLSTIPPPAAASQVNRARGPSRSPRARPAAVSGNGERARRESRRDRDLAAFREHRRRTLAEAHSEARTRIALAGELASIADALAALEHPAAEPWSSERERLQSAVASGRIVDVGAAARRALWAVSRDAARHSRRARRDPDLALAVCVAYAIIARLPRTALRSAQRTRPVPDGRCSGRHAFWR